MGAKTFDWEAVHRRVAMATLAISGDLTHGPDRARRVLEARARFAAKPPASPDDRARLEVLTFVIAGEAFGVETRYVREVCQLKDLTALPGTPPSLAGVMNLRGEIVAIFDLRRFFDLPARGLTELNRVIVLRDEGRELGLLADSIDGVHSLVASDLQEGLATLTGVRGSFLKGVTRQMLALLDGARLLTDEHLRIEERPTP